MDGDVNIFKILMVYNMDFAKLGKHILWEVIQMNYMQLFCILSGSAKCFYSSKGCISDLVSNCHTLYLA